MHWFYHPQHGDSDRSGAFGPDATIIVNHTGMPLGYGPFARRTREVQAQWQATMPKIAACPNVVMKLGGMMMRLAASTTTWHQAQCLLSNWRPVGAPTSSVHRTVWREALHVREQFPVDKMGIGYAALLERVQAHRCDSVVR